MTDTTLTTPTIRAWDEPEGIGARGTLIVLGGRGDTPDVYERFGTRISRDAYKVRALGDAAVQADAVRAAARELLSDASLPSPRVLVGSDAGAALAIELASEGIADAVVVAGLPVGAVGPIDGDQIAARTACPNHQGVLRRAAAEGTLDETLPPELLAIVASGVQVPVLGIHGDADTVSDPIAALEVLRAAPHAELHLVRDGRHDILNDVTHRSVAATVVLFLERVKASGALEQIVVSA